MKLRVSPGFDPLKAQVGPDEYFVLSRIDGSQTIREILLATGLPIDRGIAIVTKLRSIGALLLPGETSAPAPAQAPARPTPTRTASTTPVAPMTPAHGVPVPDVGRAPTIQAPGSQPVVSRTHTPHMPSTGRTPAHGVPRVEPPVVSRTMTPHLQMPQKRPAPARPLDLGPPPRPASTADIEHMLPNPTDAERAALA